MKTSDVLSKAADKIERDGWMRYDRGPREGPHCALGGIDSQFDRDFMLDCEMGVEWHAAVAALANALPKTDTREAWIVANWNNAPERTKEEVIAMLRAVATTEKAREQRLLPVVLPVPCHACEH